MCIRDRYVFSDRRLGGADVLATSYTLSQSIRSVGDFDPVSYTHLDVYKRQV